MEQHRDTRRPAHNSHAAESCEYKKPNYVHAYQSTHSIGNLLCRQETPSVDIREPSGLTPLMIVATGKTVNGLGIEAQDEEDENSAGAIIADLVAQGADLHATAPDTGETPLHLAARYTLAFIPSLRMTVSFIFYVLPYTALPFASTYYHYY